MIYATNLPIWERALRTLAGCTIIAWVWLDVPSAPMIAIAVGVCLMATSLLGYCPGCAMVGRRPVGS